MRQMFDSMFEIETTDYSYLVKEKVGGAVAGYYMVKEVGNRRLYRDEKLVVCIMVKFARFECMGM